MNRKKSITYNTDTADRHLIRKFKSNDIRAFDELIMKYQDMIFNLCFRLIGDYDEASDCAQETFVKTYKNIDKYEFRSSFSTWLYRIAVNTCKNYLASRTFRIKKNSLRLDNPYSPENSIYTTEIRDRAFNPVKLLEKKEKSEAIQKAIDTLPPKQKLLIVLRDIEGKSYNEIVEITDIKLGTVKSKLTRARQHLRSILKDSINDLL